ncbi:MAG: ubiquitin-conjugating enzyme E2 [Candidatus Micrarchaeia archaeon]
MPQLPETVWRRRVETEYLQLVQKGVPFTASADKLSYDFALRGPGLVADGNGEVRRVDEHRVRLTLNREYPYAGGFELVWLTPIFHPNIREDGKVCIQLVNKWSAGQTMANIVDALHQLLENPNPDSPLNTDAARYFMEHPNALSSSSPSAREIKKPRILS